MSLLKNIMYLEGQDVTPSGELKPHVTKGKPVLLMLQGNFCGYCTKAKPAFQSLQGHPKFSLATVQTDGGPSDAAAGQILGKYNSSGGVPAFLLFDSNGKFKAMHQGNRDAESLVAFASSL